MRKAIAWLLMFLGAALLAAGVVAQFWGKDAARVTPEEVDTTTYLAGTADKLNPSTGEVENLDVKVRNVTESDTEVTDDEVIVFVTSTCVMVDEEGAPDCVGDEEDDRLVSASTDVFAADRETAEAVNDDQYLPEDAVPHEGLVNKFPFDTERRSYDYWDGLLGEAVEVSYAGTDTLNGLDTYLFTTSIQEEPAEVVEGVDGLYSSEKTIWVEPKTGAIVNQEQHEVRTLEDGDLLLDLTVAFTDDQVDDSVAEAEDNVRTLWLVSTLIPLGGTIGGVLLLVGGALLLLLGRGSGRRAG